MTATIAHRGPDGDGFHSKRPGRRWDTGGSRSSTSPAAAQPMGNEDGTVWITYNGEIYNDPELRRSLEKARRQHCLPDPLRHREPGPPLRGRRDPTSPGHLNGMFALAIWDEPTAADWSWPATGWARSRCSMRRTARAATFVFGSEPKALLAHPEVLEGARPRPALAPLPLL